MDLHNTEPGSGDCEAPLLRASESASQFAPPALPRRATEALVEPIVQATMAADRVDPSAFEALLRRIALQLAWRHRQPDARPAVHQGARG
jgi:hypothetical protein